MSEDDLWDALEGLMAYDTGCVSSGIHDALLKARALEQVRAMDEETARLFLSRKLRDAYLSEDGLAQGYGYEDVAEFAEWLDRA